MFENNIKKLRTLSIATLILVPLVTLVLFLIVSRRGILLPGIEFVLIFLILGGILFAFFAVLQLQVKQKLEGKDGFLVRLSPWLSILIAIALELMSTWGLISMMHPPTSYAFTGSSSGRKIALFIFLYVLFLALLSFYTAIQTLRKKESSRILNLLFYICYFGYCFLPIYSIIVFGWWGNEK